MWYLQDESFHRKKNNLNSHIVHGVFTLYSMVITMLIIMVNNHWL